MIPKIIHYCWFGRNSKPKLAEKCIKSWKKHCPDYEIIEWSEDNYDLSLAPLYVRQAYEMKRWAFVADYVRLHVVYENGGFYMDTDVELLKGLDSLLKYEAFFGFEDGIHINTGLGFGAVRGNPILKEMMDDYMDIPFILPDGTIDLETCPSRNTKVLLRHGLVQNNSKQLLGNSVMILPKEYLCPLDYLTGKRNINDNTFSIHWFGESWKTEQERQTSKEWRRKLYFETRWNDLKALRYKLGKKLFGDAGYERIKMLLKKRQQ